MNQPQSNTLRLSVTLPANVNSYQNVIIELYTNASFREKYSFQAKAGYGQVLVGASPNIAKVILTAKQQAKMNGSLFYDIKLISGLDTNAEQVSSAGIDTGIVITFLASKNDY